jgi:hypothetical protein
MLISDGTSQNAVLDGLIPGTAGGGSQSVAGGEIPNITLNNDAKIANDIDTKPNETKNKLWMDFDDFFVCFK